jgi:hypothetical protein
MPHRVRSCGAGTVDRSQELWSAAGQVRSCAAWIRESATVMSDGEGSRGGDQPRPYHGPRARKSGGFMGRGRLQPFVQQMGNRHHTTAGPPIPTGGPPPRGRRGGGRDLPIRDTIPRVQVLNAARGKGAGGGEALTSAESAQQTCDARSVSRRYRPRGVSDGGRDGSGVGHYAMRSLSQRGSSPARAGSCPLRHGTRWAMVGVVRSGLAWVRSRAVCLRRGGHALPLHLDVQRRPRFHAAAVR